MEYSPKDYKHIKSIVVAIVEAQTDPEHPQALTRLSILEIGQAQAEKLKSLVNFRPFLELPSLRRFSASAINIVIHPLSLEPCSLELSSLDLHQCCYLSIIHVVSAAMFSSLAEIPLFVVNGESFTFTIRFLMGELLKYAADTLEEIVIIGGGHSHNVDRRGAIDEEVA